MRHLEFVEPTENGFVTAVAAAAHRGFKRVRLPTATPLAAAVGRAIAAQVPEVAIDEVGVRAGGAAPPSATVLCETDGERLTAALMGTVDDRTATIIAPLTDHHWSRRSLFLISIPKSGTHLLTELAHAFGYKTGGEPPATNPLLGAWHFLEFTNSHTAAPDFFVDTVRRAPHGNRFHPFPFHPALFIYRNPLDIVTSEANYYYKDGATAFSGYFTGLSDEERLLRLIDDPQLLSSIRDRVGKFAAWLDFGNVIPVSYEELVGGKGGGSTAAQEDLIWSVMLRLHVPGDPADYAKRIYNPNSQTFGTGKIGSHQRRFTPAAWEKFNALPQDFMSVYGYAQRPAEGPWLPSRAGEFRRRLPAYSHAGPGDVAVIIRRNFLGHNIYRHGSRFYALPVTATAGGKKNFLLEANDQATVEYLVHTKLLLETTGIASLIPSAKEPPRE